MIICEKKLDESLYIKKNFFFHISARLLEYLINRIDKKGVNS